ncbi:MAG: oxidoreductase [Pelagibacterium sp. SCN 64-44]|nr:MAG: oxidoreductase [Pelagibacterium sp. SCN 64-44]
MEHTITLNDGHVMPRLGYGVWQVGDDQVEPLVRTAVQSGFRHIDTAQGYSNEQGVGRALRGLDTPRESLFITSKLRSGDMGHDKALRSFEGSLDRLGLDYLDLFLIHWPLPARDRYVDTWKAFIELRASGRVRSIGVSNFTPAHLDRLIAETGVVPAVNQIELHPFFQQRAVRDHHRHHDIVIESYSPLGGTGGKLLENETIAAIAAKHGRKPAQIVIRWHLQQGLVPLPKTATASRIPENLTIWDFALDDDDMASLAALDRPDGKTLPPPDVMNDAF